MFDSAPLCVLKKLRVIAVLATSGCSYKNLKEVQIGLTLLSLNFRTLIFYRTIFWTFNCIKFHFKVKVIFPIIFWKHKYILRNKRRMNSGSFCYKFMHYLRCYRSASVGISLNDKLRFFSVYKKVRAKWTEHFSTPIPH